MEWQPIETAPQDRTRILLWDGGQVIGAQWETKGAGALKVGYWAADDWNEGCCGCAPDEVIDPTHWMPLPEPPEKTA